MKLPVLEVFVGQELPDVNVFWYATSTTLVDFSETHTYELKIVDPADTDTAIVTKSSGFTGAAGSLASDTPNLVVAFSTSGDLNLLDGEMRYLAQIKATRLSDTKHRFRQFYIDTLTTL